jgi:hypothetical protein
LDKFSFTLLLVLLCILVLALIVLTSVGIYVLLRKNNRVSTVLTPEIVAENDKAAQVQRKDLSIEADNQGYCASHAGTIAVSMCAICGDLVCDECHRGHDSLHFCTRHFETFLRYQWKVLDSVVTTPKNPEKGIFLYQFKQNEWSSKNIPSYIMTHYKIDVESDSIESHIHLFVREEDYENLKETLSQYHMGSSNQ